AGDAGVGLVRSLPLQHDGPARGQAPVRVPADGRDQPPLGAVEALRVAVVAVAAAAQDHADLVLAQPGLFGQDADAGLVVGGGGGEGGRRGRGEGGDGTGGAEFHAGLLYAGGAERSRQRAVQETRGAITRRPAQAAAGSSGGTPEARASK